MRLHSTATHGTGCTLASAIATGLALGQPLNFAVEEARRYVRHAIETAPGFGRGHGPLNHGWPLRRSEEHTSELQSLMRTSYAVFCLKKKKKNLRISNTSQLHTNTKSIRK